MRLTRIGLPMLLALLAMIDAARGQSTTGTIRGRVVDPQGVALQGAAVTLTSDHLQGPRATATSEYGDYLLAQLPPGRYLATFELSGFQTFRREVTLAPTQVLPLDVAFSSTALEENLVVVGSAVNVVTRSAQKATSFPQPLIADLPTNRDINASVLMAPAVHPTGPNGAYSINGSMSFESLFMVNGVSVSENLRGQPYDLYVEDAIQETAVASNGISAEFGRFTGGVVNVITKSGSNRFAGSVRDTLQNDKWRAYSPFEQRSIANDPNHLDTRVDRLVPTYEFTFGGPAVRDRLWFFASGRKQTLETARTTVSTVIPYVVTDNAYRYEANATYSPAAGHRVQGVLITNNTDTTNASQSATTSMDLNSLYDASRLMNLFTLSYAGAVTPRFFVEARAAVRNETLEHVGGGNTDRIHGTLLLARSPSTGRFWAPTFCGVCDPEQRDGADVFLKGSYFLSTRRLGSHDIAFGYDGYNDARFANNHQEGSDYRVSGVNALIVNTTSGPVIYPQFLPDGNTLIQWQPIQAGTEGSNFRTHSFFYNDIWRISSRVTASLGLRYDRNHGSNSVATLVAEESSWSPRLAVTFDPTGTQQWTVTASVAKYVAGLANTIADATSPGGNADTYAFAYRGPAINPDVNGALLSTPDALAQLFAWFDGNGAAALPLAQTPTVRGVTPQMADSLESPYAIDYSAGISRQIGNRGSVRADFTFRKFHNFYAYRTDLTTGRVTDARSGNIPASVLGRTYDLTLLDNTDALERTYAGLAIEGQYRIGTALTAGGNYTLSRLWGNIDGETLNAGPTPTDVLQFPEYRQAAWNYPTGDLAADQRHRARIFGTYLVPKAQGLSIGIVQILETGVPYGAVGTVNAAAAVANPGYVTPPTTSAIAYYYTDRDAFRTEGQERTDLAVNFAHRLPGRSRLEGFAQLQIVNLFNHYQLCACGASTVFQNGGSVILGRIDQTVRTAANPVGGTYASFNPFTATPQQFVNWDRGVNFGTGTSRQAFTTPRTIRLSFGVRF